MLEKIRKIQLLRGQIDPIILTDVPNTQRAMIRGMRLQSAPGNCALLALSALTLMPDQAVLQLGQMFGYRLNSGMRHAGIRGMLDAMEVPYESHFVGCRIIRKNWAVCLSMHPAIVTGSTADQRTSKDSHAWAAMEGRCVDPTGNCDGWEDVDYVYRLQWDLAKIQPHCREWAGEFVSALGEANTEGASSEEETTDDV